MSEPEMVCSGKKDEENMLRKAGFIFSQVHSLEQVSVDEDLCADPEKGHVSSSEWLLQDRHSASSYTPFFWHLGTKGTRSSSY